MSKHLSAVPNREIVADGLASVQEACTFLGCKKSMLYELMQTQLSWTRIGGKRMIPRRALIEFAAAGLVRHYPAAS